MIGTSGSSHPHKIETLEAALLLTNRQELRYLKPFILRECTVSEAAAELGVKITPMYKKLERLLKLGLVRETRQTARVGRAIRHYRAVAEQFFVPFTLHPPELIGEPNRKHHMAVFEQNIQRLYRSEAFVEQGLGVATGFTEAGEIYLRFAYPNGEPWDYTHPQAPAMLSGWNPLRLEPAEAKALQKELFEVMLKYLGKEGKQTYLSGVFLIPLVEG